MKRKLIIARHHESEWNKLGKWTGSVNVGLTNYGFQMSRAMGTLIKDLAIDLAFTSTQIRALETLLCMEDGDCIDVPIIRSAAFNERDYGDYTGKNKLEMKKILGEIEFEKIHRDWNYPIPNGESLEMTYNRVVPYYLETMVPLLCEDKTIILVAHGNSLRALIKYLENISDEEMIKVEMPFGAVIVYELTDVGRMISKDIRQVTPIVHS